MKELLGRLEKLELREAWASEAGAFTPWLAKQENLKLLGESIGLDLECESQEARIGLFRADIVCKDSTNDSTVLIENQLERTDHGHLGQLLTYAAGLEAVTVIWVAERFTEEHRAALDWLNERTDEKINFFGLEIELWRIGDSLPAPKFNVVCKPNQWSRTVSDAARRLDPERLTEHRQLQYEYWTEFLAVLRSRKEVAEARTPSASGAMTFPVGRTDFRLWVEMYVREKSIGVGMTCKAPHAKHYFRLLRADAAEIERELGEKLQWDERPDNVHSYISTFAKYDPTDRKTWREQHAWLADRLARFQKVFSARTRKLPPPTIVVKKPATTVGSNR
jgi:hypothetical protein